MKLTHDLVDICDSDRLDQNLAELKRFAEEQFAGLHNKSSAPHHPARKVTLKAMSEVKKLAENPELGAYRVSAALE